MPLDPAVVRALHQAVKEEGQPAVVANQLEAWLLDVGEGDGSIDAQMLAYEVLRKQLLLGDEDAN